MFPTGMLETATQRRVLRVLAEKNRRYTIDELAEMCHRSEAAVSRALQHAERYPFVEKTRVTGSKRLAFRLDPTSRYSAPIREFFEVEHDRERQNGTVPVDVWNLLEDVTSRFSDNVDGFVELFLFGSYATGEYYAGSDVDLLLVHSSTGDVKGDIDSLVQSIGDDRIHVIPVQLPVDRDEMTDDQLLQAIQQRSPVGDVDVIVPLAGEVAL